MAYLLDTNAILRHFASISQLGSSAKEVIEKGENGDFTLYISVISLMEIMYLFEKNRIPISLFQTIQLIQDHPSYVIVDLTTEIITQAESISFYELHDRLILATAKYLGVPVVSSDRRFAEVSEIKVIW